HSLPSLRGRRVLLSFHPLAWTGVCQRQMEALEMNADRWEQLNVSAFGVSVDSAPCKKAWAQSIHVEKTPLLADFWPHGGLARALGLFREQEGFSERANVLIDENGMVRWIKIYPLPEAPDIEELMDAIRTLES
ncbi:MAG TPA: redoxin domain-containing protein, partial [Candidatus Acetothermia bacterium]|nr:redoxin domain-containing protein [Candidatus Acetothermia bacterium]